MCVDGSRILKKTLRIQKYLDTCGLGLRLLNLIIYSRSFMLSWSKLSIKHQTDIQAYEGINKFSFDRIPESKSFSICRAKTEQREQYKYYKNGFTELNWTIRYSNAKET